MTNFSDFIKNSAQERNKNEREKTSGYDQQKLEDMINSYSTYSKDQLLNEFIKLTIDKKKRGELTPKDIENLKATLGPMLNAEQKQNLDKILQVVENV